MKNGSIPQRILREIRGRRIVRRADVARPELGGYDQVGRALSRLTKEGHLEKIDRATWLRLSHELPRLAHARTWSRPDGAPDDLVLRATLAKPSYDDLAALCLTLGFARVTATLDELVTAREISQRTARRDREIIANVKAGLIGGGDRHDRAAP